jgi:hypothetical protein
VALANQRFRQVGTDETIGAGNENFFCSHDIHAPRSVQGRRHGIGDSLLRLGIQIGM